MAYIEVDISIPENRSVGRDISIAELGEACYESFMETETGLKAYILKEHFDKNLLDRLTILNTSEFGSPEITSKEIEETNWNARWESEYEAVSVNSFCYIRTPFHPPSDKHRYEVIIEPKMSFGTGHHETTCLMISMMEKLDFSDSIVLDLGCGTGVLSILASMLGSREVSGLDTDPWAFENAIENLDRNNIDNCTIMHGDLSLVKGRKYDIILANISRNINLEYMQDYKHLCRAGGYLVLSGFYSEDLDVIRNKASLFAFSYLEHKTKDNWVSVLFTSQK